MFTLTPVAAAAAATPCYCSSSAKPGVLLRRLNCGYPENREYSPFGPPKGDSEPGKNTNIFDI